MKTIGIICEYNPFHNGHIYHLKKIKAMFPDSLLILVLNGYFLERGEISIISKVDKTKIALENNIDLIVELPVVFGTQSADIFAETAIFILNQLKVTDIIFGSESANIELINKLANLQLQKDFNYKVKTHLKNGVNYPTALSLALNQKTSIKTPNDLLGISYAKAILKNNYNITLHTIKRTSEFHDLESNYNIVSASNIRYKLKHKQNIAKFVPKNIIPLIQNINEELLWNILKYKIVTSNDLAIHLTVDEGIEKRLKKLINETSNIEDFILNVKTKRYTYNKIQRMLIHILLGITKKDNTSLKLDYIHILGFNKNGQEHLKKLRGNTSISLTPIFSSKIYKYEKRAAFLYELLTNSPTSLFELQNKPIIKDNNIIFDKKK